MRVALSVARPKTALPELSRNHRSELQHPAPDSFVGDVEPTLREQILHVALAQRKVQVEHACRSSPFNSKGEADSHHVSSGIHRSRLHNRKVSGYTAHRQVCCS